MNTQSPPPPSLPNRSEKESEMLILISTAVDNAIDQYAEELKGKIQLMIDYALGGNSVRSLSKCAQERVLTLQEVLSLLERKGEK